MEGTALSIHEMQMDIRAIRRLLEELMRDWRAQEVAPPATAAEVPHA